jgi:hypothetical protein
MYNVLITKLKKNYSLFHLFIKNFVSLLLYDFHELKHSKEAILKSYTTIFYSFI